MLGYSINRASTGELLSIREWLKQEADEGGDSFFCNYNLIEKGQKDGSLLIATRDSDRLPVAFCLGDENIDILAVKRDCRRIGVGEFLAMHFVESSRDRDAIGLVHECAPTTSISFWKSLGFCPVECPSRSGNEFYVALSFSKSRPLPDGKSCTIRIAIENATYDFDDIFETDGSRNESTCSLASDFVQYLPNPDTRIRILVDGEQTFCDKNKRLNSIGGERSSPWVRIRTLVAG